MPLVVRSEEKQAERQEAAAAAVLSRLIGAVPTLIPSLFLSAPLSEALLLFPSPLLFFFFPARVSLDASLLLLSGVSLDACVVAGSIIAFFSFFTFCFSLSSVPTPPSLVGGGVYKQTGRLQHVF